MSEIAEKARVSVFLADYAAADGLNKINLLGGGWQVTRLEPTTGNTASMALLVMVDTPPEHYSESFALEIALVDDAGEMVQMPGPTGTPAPLRIGQSIVAEAPDFPGQFVPKNALWAHTQFLVNFPGGPAAHRGDDVHVAGSVGRRRFTCVGHDVPCSWQASANRHRLSRSPQRRAVGVRVARSA